MAALVVGVMTGLAARQIVGAPGRPYPDLSTAPKLSSSSTQSIANLSEPPGNIAVSSDGRVFFSLHPEARPEKVRVAELVDGRMVPFPSETAQEELFDTVFSVRIDRQGRLWTLDHGFNGLRQPRLLAFDPGSRKLVHRFDVPNAVAGLGSFLNDFQVDSRGQRVFIADTSVFARRPAIIVYDVRSKSASRFLEGDVSVLAEDWLIQTPQREMTFLGGLIALKPAVDSIVLDKDDEWLYFGAMAGSKLYRVRVANLTPGTDAARLARQVEVYSRKPLSDGLSIDLEGRIYVTDVEHAGIAVIHPDRRVETLTRDERIRWPDGLSFGPGGDLFLTDSALNETMLRSRSHIRASGPFHIFKISLKASAVPGH